MVNFPFPRLYIPKNDTDTMNLTDTTIAEWALARLQVEGLRQKSTIDPNEKSAGLRDLKQAPELPTVANDSSKAAGTIAPPSASVGDPNSTTTDHGSYQCIYGKHSGRLHVTSIGIHYRNTLGARERDQWEVRYENMDRVEKVRNNNDHPPIEATNLLITFQLLIDQSYC